MDSAHQSRWAIAEVVFGIPFLTSLALQWVIPLSLDHKMVSTVGIAIGIVLIIAGMCLIVFARREFARYDQPTDPGNPTSKIINPIS